MAEQQDGMRYQYTADLAVDSVATKIVRLIARGARVLDLGCGPGSLAQPLAERGCAVVGVEQDPVSAQHAREHCQEVLVADLDTVDLGELLGERRFDVVLAADVIEHLRNPVPVLAAARRALDPGGYAVLSVPNVAHASVRLALLSGTFPYSDTGLLDRTHLHFWTRDSLTGVAADAGFELLHVQAQRLGVFDSEVPVPEAARRPELVAAATADPDALSYQFVALGWPTPAPGEELAPLAALVQRLDRELSAQSTAVGELTARLTSLAGTDPLMPDGLPAPETVQAMLEAREQLRRAEFELSAVLGTLSARTAALTEAEEQRLALAAELRDAKEQLAASRQEAEALLAWQARALSFPAYRAYRIARRLAGRR